MIGQSLKVRRIIRGAMKVMDRCERKGALSAEDWYLLNLPPTEAGDRSGHWQPVMVFVPKPRRKKRRR